MKRCPECRRDYYDDSLLYCLDDGSALLEGPASVDEPATAIFTSTDLPSESATKEQNNATDQTVILPSGSFSGKDIPPTSSAEYIFNEVRSHKRTVAVGLAILIVAAAGLGYWFIKMRTPTNESSPIGSIAVLPFQNKSSDANTEYLSDGLAESLIYRLSQLPNLKVSPTSSVIRYKGKETEVAKIAGELGVDAVMTGRLAQMGDNLTISVELVDVRNNTLLWGEQYDRKMSDLLATQREIAAAIMQKLQIKLSGDDAKGITKRYTDNNEAYQYYLRGRHLWNKRTAESLKQAIEFYRQAVEKDPSFALAYSGLAETYVLYSDYDIASPKDSMPQAKAAALRALELDDSLAEAHTALGWHLVSYEYDWVGGERELRRAIELNPNYATAHQWLGQILSMTKRFDEGQAETKRALEADPLSPIIRMNIGYQALLARRYDEALKEFEKANTLYPDSPIGPACVCWAAFNKGALDQAIPACKKAWELVPDAYNTGYLALVLGRAGQRDEARKLLEQLRNESLKREVPSFALALAHMGLDQKEEAIAMLEKEVDEHGYWATSLAVLPELDEFRNDPRFKVMLKRINQPE